MAVTVMIRRRARPGQEDAFLRASVRGTAGYATSDSLLRSARVLQRVQDPADFLWLAEWESREAYDANLNDVQRELELLAAGPRERSFLEVVHSSEYIERRVAALTCVVVNATAQTVAQARDMMQTRGKALLEANPGFAARYLYRDVERAHRLVAVLGWSSLAAAEQAVQIIDRHADELVDALGLERQSFVGRVAVEVHTGAQPSVWYPVGSAAP
jgi:heme-degrading monooxygenase HmoA